MSGATGEKSKRPLREMLVRAAVLELCAAVRLDDQVADRALEKVIKREKALFSSERRAIGEDLFQLLRQERFLDFALGLNGACQLTQRTRFAWRYAALQVLRGRDPVQTAEAFGFDGAVAQRLAHLKTEVPHDLPIEEQVAVVGSVPDCLARVLVSDLGETDALAFARCLQERAAVTLRVNTLQTSRESLQKSLRRQGIETRFTPISPFGLVAQGFPRLTDTEAFQQGAFEIQDEGSQILAMLVDPKPNELVADTCAGAGGKTLALAAMMEGKGRIWAMDVGEGRLKNLTKRLKRSASKMDVQTKVIPEVFDPSKEAPKLVGKCHRVLVDAPCSGSGVLRRSPEAKYRFDDETFQQFAQLQSQILHHHSALVRPGGRLVYATCSVARMENEDVVHRFLEAHPEFSLVDPSTLLPSGAATMVRKGFFRPLPHLDRCDGFFGAVMVRQDC